MKDNFKRTFYLLMLGVMLYAPKVMAVSCYKKDGDLVINNGNELIIDGQIPNVISTIVTIIKIAVPVILIIMGMIDLGKGVVAQKEDEIKKGQQIFIKRLIAGALVFFAFTIVQLVVGFARNDKDGNIMGCAKCFLNGVDDCGESTVTSDHGDDVEPTPTDTPIPQVIEQDEKASAVYQYDANGVSGAAGIPSMPTIAYYNDTVTTPTTTPTAKGYTFSKWCTKKDGTGACYGVTGANAVIVKAAKVKPVDTTLYAIWNAKTYNLVLSPNDATCSEDGRNCSGSSSKTIKMAYASTKNNKVEVPKRTGYKFKGYYTSPTSGIQVYADTGEYNALATDYWKNGGKWYYDSNVTLYAHWEKA